MKGGQQLSLFFVLNNILRKFLFALQKLMFVTNQ